MLLRVTFLLLFANIQFKISDAIDSDYYSINAPGSNKDPVTVERHSKATYDTNPHRYKRQTPPNVVPFTEDEKQAIVNKHNEYRMSASNPTAANMQFMVSFENFVYCLE